jgi:hypothetical protein
MGAGNPPPPGFDPRTVQLVVSCYTDYAILGLGFIGEAINWLTSNGCWITNCIECIYISVQSCVMCSDLNITWCTIDRRYFLHQALYERNCHITAIALMH